MATGDLTIGIPGSGTSDFATLPIPSLALNRWSASTGPPVRGEIGYATLTGRSTNGISQIVGPSYGEKIIWPVTTLITQTQARQLGALAKWQSRRAKSTLTYPLAAGNNSGNGTLVVTGAIAAETPNKGLIYVKRDTGAIDAVPYSSFTGSTFTLVGTLPATYTAGNDSTISAALRCIDEIDLLESEPSPHSRTLLSSTAESFNGNYVYGYGVFDVLIALPENWKQLIGRWNSGGGARAVSFSLFEL